MQLLQKVQTLTDAPEGKKHILQILQGIYKLLTSNIHMYIHSPATLLGTPVQLLGSTNC